MRSPFLTSVAGLVLLALLPGIGGGGAARAGYRQSVGDDVSAPVAWGKVSDELVRGEAEKAAVPASAPRPSDSPPPITPPEPGRKTTLPGHTGGAGGSGSSLPTSGGVVAAGLIASVEIPLPTRSALLFLAECSLRQQAFSSRLFRPPRA